MADTEEGVPGEKEADKPASPKPDQEVSPPLVSVKSKFCLSKISEGVVEYRLLTMYISLYKLEWKSNLYNLFFKLLQFLSRIDQCRVY